MSSKNLAGGHLLRVGSGVLLLEQYRFTVHLEGLDPIVIVVEYNVKDGEATLTEQSRRDTYHWTSMTTYHRKRETLCGLTLQRCAAWIRENRESK